jgi:hypothetical protein
MAQKASRRHLLDPQNAPIRFIIEHDESLEPCMGNPCRSAGISLAPLSFKLRAESSCRISTRGC